MDVRRMVRRREQVKDVVEMGLFDGRKYGAVESPSEREKRQNFDKSPAGQAKQQESIDRANSGRPQRDR